MAPPISAYDGTPAGAARQAVETGAFGIKGDEGRKASAIFAADSAKHPFRLVPAALLMKT